MIASLHTRWKTRFRRLPRLGLPGSAAAFIQSRFAPKSYRARACGVGILTVALVIALLMVTSVARGLQIRVFDPARQARFISDYPANPLPNPGFYQKYYDFSGVGWHAGAPYLSYTLISPRHFVGANHVKPGVGSALKFRGRDGVVRAYTVASQHNITNAAGQHTDLFVGRLAEPVATCDHVTFYPILKLPSEANFIGQSLLVYGREARVGVGTINSFIAFGGDPLTGTAGVNDTRAYAFAYVNVAGGGDDCFFEGGDSGSPSFVASNGQLFVVGVHLALVMTGAAADNVDSFVPFYLNQITGLLQADDYQPAHSAAETFRLCYDVSRLDATRTVVSWVGHPGRVYRLEAATNFSNFTPISGLITATVATVTFTDSNAVEAVKFYRAHRFD